MAKHLCSASLLGAFLPQCQEGSEGHIHLAVGDSGPRILFIFLGFPSNSAMELGFTSIFGSPRKHAKFPVLSMFEK